MQFKEDGYAVIRGYLTEDDIDELKQATTEVIQYCKDEPVTFFSVHTFCMFHVSKSSRKFRVVYLSGCLFVFQMEDRLKNNYFAKSGDSIRGFYENDLDDNNCRVLNKIGHMLHLYNQTFVNHTINDRVRKIISNLTEMETPTVIQGQIIFKHAKVGGPVKPHQDSNYLYTDPTPGKLIGFWFPLDEATEENGCLYFIPGSHKPGVVYQRFVKNLEKGADELFSFRGNPCPYDKEKAVPVPAKPGDLVLIDGLVIHQSEPNKSAKSRMAYTFHVIDGAAKWSEENWLQPTQAGNFVKY